MPKKFKLKKKAIRRGPIKANDTYSYVSDLVVEDVDGDGVGDAVFTHTVTRTSDDKVVNKSTIIWPGLDGETAEMFADTLEEAGVEIGTQTFNSFKEVVKEWRKLTKAIGKINDLGELFAVHQLGE